MIVYRQIVKIGYWIDTGEYCIHAVSSPAPIHTQYCPVLYLYWVVMDCTVFVSDLYCIPDRTVQFLYQLFTVYQKPAPIRYCPVPCLYWLSGTRFRYMLLDGIETMCKTVPFGTFPIPCTGNTISEQYQFLPYNSTGTVPSSTVMFTG